MNLNDRFLRGVLLGLGVGGVSGYLLATHLHRSRLDAELNEVRDYYRAKSENLERDGMVSAFRVVPTGRDSDHRAGSPGFRPVGSLAEDATGSDTQQPDGDDRISERWRDESGDIDPLLGLEDDDYEPGAARSLGVDGSGNPVEDELAELDPEGDGSEDEGSHPDGHASSAGGHTADPRGPGPYLISEAEFSQDCEDYQKLTVMYYKGDNVLIDSDEAVIPDIRGTIGAGTTDKFGQDAENPHILYVRNDKIQVDFEICLDYGKYVEVVLKYGTPNPKPPRLLLDGG